MLLFPIALAAGLGMGLLVGGRVTALGQFAFRWTPLVVLSIAVQAALAISGARFERTWPGLVLFAASYLAGGAWVAANLKRRPRRVQICLVIMGIGWFLNTLVVLPNGGMPVSSSALRTIGLNPRLALAGGGPLGKHVGANGHVVLATLGDNIAVPWLHTIVSAGDMVLLAGLALLLPAIMTTSRILRVGGV